MFVLSREHPSLASAVVMARLRLHLARHRPLVTAAALLAVVLVGVVEYFIRGGLGLTLFYLAPIVIAGWWTTDRTTTLVAGTAALGCLVAELARGDVALGAVTWNAVTKLIIFLAAGLGVARIRVAHEKLATATAELAHLLEREATLALTDALTGLPNFRAFRDHVREEVGRHRALGAPFVVAYLDLDNFKHVNDLYGHAAGDELLRAVGRLLPTAVRAGDVIARLGGDEFAVSFAECRPGDAERVVGRLANIVRSAGSRYPRADVSASVGLALFDVAPANDDEALRQADEAMYQAKRQGKACVVARHVARPGTAAAPAGARP